MTGLTRRQLLHGASIASLGLLAACGPPAGQAQPPTSQRVYRIGVLRGSTPFEDDQSLILLRQALGELGYVEGRNLAIEYRWDPATGEQLAAYAAELVGLPVDVLVVLSAPAAVVAHQVTTTVPIVPVGPGDPAERGIAASYAPPGGNVTGVINLARPLNTKRLQLLKEAAPAISRVAVFWDPALLGPFPAESWARDAEAIGVA